MKWHADELGSLARSKGLTRFFLIENILDNIEQKKFAKLFKNSANLC